MPFQHLPRCGRAAAGDGPTQARTRNPSLAEDTDGEGTADRPGTGVRVTLSETQAASAASGRRQRNQSFLAQIL